MQIYSYVQSFECTELYIVSNKINSRVIERIVIGKHKNKNKATALDEMTSDPRPIYSAKTLPKQTRLLKIMKCCLLGRSNQPGTPKGTQLKQNYLLKIINAWHSTHFNFFQSHLNLFWYYIKLSTLKTLHNRQWRDNTVETSYFELYICTVFLIKSLSKSVLIKNFLWEQFYKNNEAQIWPKIKNNIRTIQTGVWNHKYEVYFS